MTKTGILCTNRTTDKSYKKNGVTFAADAETGTDTNANNTPGDTH